MRKKPNNSRREPIFPESAVAVVPLTKGYITIIDAEDWQRISKYKWHATRCKGHIYARSKSADSKYLHRFINNTPKGKETDHANRNTLDNRKCNLRVCTSSQNKRNLPPRSKSSIYKGVSKTRSGKWAARAASPEGKYIWLGVFETEIEAARAYDDYIRKIAPEFGYLNFPED